MKNLLQTALASAIGKLVEKLVVALEKIDIENVGATGTIIMAVTALRTLRFLGNNEEASDLFMFVGVQYALLEQEVPEAIRVAFGQQVVVKSTATVTTMPAPKPAATQTVQAVVHAPLAPAPKPVAGADREVDHNAKMKTWRDLLKKVVLDAENMSFGMWKKLQSMSILMGSEKLMASDWELLLQAMVSSKMAGKFIISDACRPLEWFKTAPVGVLAKTIFGSDGLVVMTKAEVADYKGTTLQSWVAPNVGVILDMANALSTQRTLSDDESAMIARLVDELDKKGAPEWCLRKGNFIVSPHVTQVANDVVTSAFTKAGVVEKKGEPVSKPDVAQALAKEPAPAELSPTPGPRPNRKARRAAMAREKGVTITFTSTSPTTPEEHAVAQAEQAELAMQSEPSEEVTPVVTAPVTESAQESVPAPADQSIEPVALSDDRMGEGKDVLSPEEEDEIIRRMIEADEVANRIAEVPVNGAPAVPTNIPQVPAEMPAEPEAVLVQ